MNILTSIIVYPPDYTGAGLRIHRLYTALRKKGVNDVHVLTTSERPLSSVKSSIDGIRLIYAGENQFRQQQEGLTGTLRKGLLAMRASFCAFRNVLRLRRQIDVVHVVGISWLTVVVAWTAKLLHKPLVIELVLMGCDDPLSILQLKPHPLRFFFLRPFHFADMIVGISTPLETSCIRYGLDPAKIWKRFNPIYIRPPAQSSAPADAHTPQKTDHKTIMWVGIMENRKNVPFLLEAARLLEGRVHLQFVGPFAEAVERQRIETLAALVARETEGRVRPQFLGQVDDKAELAKLYMNADLFWFASKSEGLGNVVLESLACGTPVVTLPIGGIMPDIVVAPRDGMVVDTEDPRRFARAVNDALYRTSYNRKEIAASAGQRFLPSATEDGYLLRFRTLIKKEGSTA